MSYTISNPETSETEAICAADIEARALASVAMALNPLDGKARLRVIKWALDFNHDAAQKQTLETLMRLDRLRQEVAKIEKENG